jgi:hypothetical protein
VLGGHKALRIQEAIASFRATYTTTCAVIDDASICMVYVDGGRAPTATDNALPDSIVGSLVATGPWPTASTAP